MKTNKKNALISLVVPVYFEEGIIDEFYRRARAALSAIPGTRYEMLFVNDGSTDKSLPLLLALSARDTNVKIIDFSRNFGHQLAITAGIDAARGDAVVVIDGDLQDPPELVAAMVEKWREGYEVVYAQRKERKGENAFKLATAKLFYRFINSLSDVNLPLDTGDFRLMDRAVVDALGQLREENRYVRGLVSWVGYRHCALAYDRDSRYAGKTKYTLSKMIRFALNGITGFSEKPLMFASYAGVFVTAVAFLYLVWIVVDKFIHPAGSVRGWSSTVAVILFFGGVQLISLGIIGAYVGRIYREVKARPLYIVRDRYGFNDNKASKR
ncbi:MAG: glycosyltransferase family 2 protein [Spirochaetes bacterium]|nr:glycosyltransferase family 2 protein [Spirochaetota bacterium]